MWRNLTLTQLLPCPSEETDQPRKHSRNTKEPGGTMAGGGPEIRDSEKWSSRPSPSQGHSAQPWAPGAGCDYHPESGAAPWLASHCSVAFWGCTWFTWFRGKQRGRNQRQKRGGIMCFVEYQGWEAGLSVLAWPGPSMQSGLFYHSVLFFWVSGLKPDSSEHKLSSLGCGLCVCVSEWDREEQEPEGSWKFQTSLSPFLGSRHVPYPTAVKEAEPDMPAEDPYASSRERDHLAAA